MSSFRQIEANRRNAQLSTGPITEEGKRRSRQNVTALLRKRSSMPWKMPKTMQLSKWL
jgi:phage-related protein